MKTLLLVDGNSMLFRAYYATAYGGGRMTTSKGIPTNAVYGFAMMLQKAIDKVQPEAVMVAFDAGKHTFRHDLYPDYKGGRKPAPDDLVPQFQMVRDYLDSFGIRWVERPDIEADDLIGSMSDQPNDYHKTILTSDHDLLQLIDADTTVMLMKKGITEMDEMTPERLQEETGLEPRQIIEMKGLMGDSSDNYPGIPGIGDKTAKKLLAQYDNVENVLAHADEIKGKLGEKIRENQDQARLSRTLATIKRDVPLDLTPEDCAFHPDYARLIQFLQSLDMKSLAARYEPYLEESEKSAPAAAAAEALQEVRKCPESLLKGDLAVYLDQDTQGYMDAAWYGLALTDGKSIIYLTSEDLIKDNKLLETLKKPSGRLIGYDIKRSWHLLKDEVRIAFTDDAMICASLVNSTLTSPEKIFSAFQLETDEELTDIYGKPEKPILPDHARAVHYAGQSVRNIWQLFAQCRPQITACGMEDLYQKIEMPLIPILKDMENQGIICDEKILSQISEEIADQIAAEEAEIYKEAGREFNINSPQQLAEVLYDIKKLPAGRKRSTSADVLEKLRQEDPIIDHILTYRKLAKINSTYAEGLRKYIWKDGRIHTLYNQAATQTGRLSSSDPNLQNISVRDEQGRIIRKAFLPSPGCVLLSCDYHQIELRVLAHMAKEPHLIEAFREGQDIHTRTAMDVFGVSADEVTPLMRRRAKTVNFGIVYGISDFGLADRLGISRQEARTFIDTYYAKYPGIKTYMDSVVADCEKNGYVTTLCGRRREIPEIHDKNRQIREFGRRAAMNAPIQGSAADLIKIAMIRIDAAMRQAGVKSRMILQVHDELIFDVPEQEVDVMKQLAEEGMTKAMTLEVPLTVEISVGRTWYEAK